MIDLIKKAALTGIGIASLTSEKLEELSKELISKGQLTEQEGQKFLGEMMQKAHESKKAIQAHTEKVVASSLEKMNLASSEDVDQLKGEIEKLREEIASLKGK